MIGLCIGVWSTPVVSASSGPPDTGYANPGGQGNRSGLITVTATMTAGGGTPANLVDGASASSYWINAGQANGLGWVFDFGAGASKYIDEIGWEQSGVQAQGIYAFGGSNDGSSFTTLASGLALGTDTGAGRFGTFAFTPSATTLWRYFALTKTGGSTSDGPYLRQVTFKISA